MAMSGYFAIKPSCPNFSFRKSYRFPYLISCRWMARKCHVNVAFSCLSGTFFVVSQQYFLKISLWAPRFHHILTAVLSQDTAMTCARHPDDSVETSRRPTRGFGTTHYFPSVEQSICTAEGLWPQIRDSQRVACLYFCLPCVFLYTNLSQWFLLHEQRKGGNKKCPR